MIDLLTVEKQFIESHIKEGGTVVDFTMGNGHDTLWLSNKVGENGKVFGSVTASHVADALSSLGFDIDKKKIKIDPIKNVGSYPAEIRLMENVSAKITVIVEGL